MSGYHPGSHWIVVWCLFIAFFLLRQALGAGVTVSLKSVAQVAFRGMATTGHSMEGWTTGVVTGSSATARGCFTLNPYSTIERLFICMCDHVFIDKRMIWGVLALDTFAGP